MKFFRTALLVLIFVAFVAGATYVAMHRLEGLGVFGDVIEEVVSEHESEEEFEPEQSGPFPYIIPMDGREVVPAELNFTFLDRDFTIQAEVDSRVYHGAVTAGRGFLLEAGASEAQRHQAIADYYNKLTFDPEMDHALESTLRQLRIIRDELELDSDQYVELITKFVQMIPYDENRGFIQGLDGSEAKALGDPRMPIQVLVDGLADCDEKVMLLAALLNYEGYATAALFFEPERHISLGIRSEGEGFAETGYEFVEATGITYVSEVPTEFVGGITLESDPFVFAFDPSPIRELARGEESYSAAAVEQVERIVAVRESAEDAAEEKRTFIEATPMTEAEFEQESALFEACITAMNGLRATVDNLGHDTGEFMDRTDAIAWIDQYAWWE